MDEPYTEDLMGENMETNLGKTMYEMSNRELFCVLTGEKGVMAQMYLQNLIREYMAANMDEPDLQTMVRRMVDKM